MKRILGVILAFAMLFYGCTSESSPIPPVSSGGGGAVPSCSDSDGGKDSLLRGSVESASGNGTDTCLEGAQSVMEYYCSGGVMRAEEIACTGGKKCVEGACAVVPCFDSDGGKEPSRKGSVQYEGAQYADSCTPEGNVREYYCSGEVADAVIGCALGEECVGGACVAKTVCTDTDGGKNVLIKGTASYGSTVQEDTCANTRAVIEQYCEGGVMKSEQIQCAEDEECSYGRCIVSPSAPSMDCTDTDGGQNVYKKGTVTYWTGGEKHTETDSCSGTYAVWENWCTSEGGIGFGPIDCDADEVCEDGECV